MSLINSVANNKIYKTILFLILIFIFIIGGIFIGMTKEMKEKVEQNRELTIKSLEFTMLLWLEQRVKSLESAVIYAGNNGIYNDEEKIVKFNQNFINSNPFFNAVQMLIPQKYFYMDGKKIIDYEKNIAYNEDKNITRAISQPWFIKTKESEKTTINEMKKHHYLHEQTINICTPIKDGAKFVGVFCGILKTDSLFDKIKEIKIPQNFYYFIVDNFGNALTELKNKELLVSIEQTCIEKNRKENISLQVGDDAVSLTKLHGFEWYLGVGVDTHKFLLSNMKKTIIYAIVSFLSFLIMLYFINLIYEFIIKKLNAKKEQYEQLLLHQSRLNEIGGLVSGINHQLKQPINSLSLIISSMSETLKKDELDKELFQSNLALCKSQIWAMNNTINIYRNFYKFDDAISEFDIIKCIKDVILVTKTELNHHNITLKFDKSYESIAVKSIENFIYQILLVLILNSKDAILSQKNSKKREILIEVSQKDNEVEICVLDFGSGVEKSKKELIFEPKQSSKKHGFGLGLCFAKMLSSRRLNGDLRLVSLKNPTKFSLNIQKNLKA
ncbi:sensor histidine kinase [Campylobacter geochelonis]|uniref:sensor histidine kinase n=1 Tax=Campylobacter geochelonis TaxID=1780362 RepID=UPI00077080CB|nr:sensor histidine kinase [Campylobacter geochelonis]CZE50733.1 His kinase A [Campylobacter geochelonis]